MLSRGRLNLLAVAALGPLLACGPYFPNRYLVGSETMLLESPTGDFAFELKRIAMSHPPDPPPNFPTEKNSVFDQSVEVDCAEFKHYLESSHASGAAELLAQYQAVRQTIRSHVQEMENATEKGEKSARLGDIAIPAGLENEFGEYLRGLVLYHQNKLGDAIAAWEKLLKRPAEQRRWRSTWSAFMIGKARLESDPPAAVVNFRLTRELAANGFRDPLGLAAASIGWEARAELNQKHFGRAIDLYLRQRDTGDPTALNSLRTCAAKAFAAGREALRPLAESRTSAEVMTAYFVAYDGRFDGQEEPSQMVASKWLAAVEAARLSPSPAADRLAWAAYRAGQFETASRWLTRADANSAISQWVGAKLALHDGNIDRAMKLLSQATESFPKDQAWVNMVYDEGEGKTASPAANTAAELAVLKLSRGQYVETLDLFLRANRRIDAAYVAEQVLTVEELRRYAASHRAPPFLRELLARRLMRAGRYAEAREYFPANLAALAGTYAASLAAGQDASQPAATRGAAMWRAAKLARYHGEDLLATEVEPDWRALSLEFELQPTREARRLATTAPIARATRDEMHRVQAASPPQRRWHYRYVAADIAWEAAGLMPENSDATAAMLVEAGNWIKAQEPKVAERFYKALLRRCPDTALAKEAVKRKWLPPIEGKSE
jgi:hypothetical protein